MSPMFACPLPRDPEAHGADRRHHCLPPGPAPGAPTHGICKPQALPDNHPLQETPDLWHPHWQRRPHAMAVWPLCREGQNAGWVLCHREVSHWPIHTRTGPQAGQCASLVGVAATAAVSGVHTAPLLHGDISPQVPLQPAHSCLLINRTVDVTMASMVIVLCSCFKGWKCNLKSESMSCILLITPQCSSTNTKEQSVIPKVV